MIIFQKEMQIYIHSTMTNMWYIETTKRIFDNKLQKILFNNFFIWKNEKD
jgi:hypothetical protein